MDKDILESYVNSGMSTRQIGTILGKSQGSIKHWMQKFELKSKFYRETSEGYRYCPCCKEEKPLNSFYKKRNKEGESTYCKKCTNTQTIKRLNLFKEKCVEYKGGCCEKCGYNKCIGALEFHHIDSNDKLFSISKSKLKKFDETIKKELDKCQLLCSNCHKEIHYL